MFGEELGIIKEAMGIVRRVGPGRSISHTPHDRHDVKVLKVQGGKERERGGRSLGKKRRGPVA